MQSEVGGEVYFSNNKTSKQKSICLQPPDSKYPNLNVQHKAKWMWKQSEMQIKDVLKKMILFKDKKLTLPLLLEIP